MEEFEVLGRNFILNIAGPALTESGLMVANRDPRKQRLKPDAYVGIVEKVGLGCELVKPQMRVVVKRWEYKQFDLDDERIIAQERDLLILDDRTPAPNVVVMKIVQDLPKTNLMLPQTHTPKKAPYHFGEVLAANCVLEDGTVVCPGDFLWIERRERDQFFQGAGRLVFKNSPDVWNGDSPVLAIGKAKKVLQVI